MKTTKTIELTFDVSEVKTILETYIRNNTGQKNTPISTTIDISNDCDICTGRKPILNSITCKYTEKND
jgi:hypothetical protein